MFDRISASFALAQSSWQVLRLDKRLVVFPVLSGLCCLLVLASFIAPFALHPQWLNFLEKLDEGGHVPPWAYAVAFAFYFCNYFVIIFFNAALVSCSLIRFNGGTPTVADGLGAAASRLPQIFAWALVSATVGVILKAIENAHEKAGAFISALLGTAWTVITYFVVPVLVVERVGPFQAVGRSIAILKKSWGEAVVGKFGLGLFTFLLAIPGILLGVVGVYALSTLPTPVLGIALLVLTGLYFVIWSAVSSALNGIFLSALYQYAANGRVPSGFESGTLERAFGKK